MVALIAPRDGVETARQDLAWHCESRVARYKLPRALVTVTEVVRSPSGKPDYGWARREALAAEGPASPVTDRSPATAA